MILVEVCYASESEQFLTEIEIPEEATVKEAIDQSGVLEKFPEINLDQNKIGIFSRFVTLAHTLKSGDRVEIYRPLKIDPKEARRLRVQAKNKISD